MWSKSSRRTVPTNRSATPATTARLCWFQRHETDHRDDVGAEIELRSNMRFWVAASNASRSCWIP